MNTVSVLLSFPRSGASWTRYIIEWFTERSTIGPPYSKSPIDLPMMHPRANEQIPPVAIKMHAEDEKALHATKLFLSKKMPLMLLLRSPLECFPRHISPEAARTIADWPATEVHPHIAYFFNNLKIYEDYEQKKDVFYYEDLVLEPEKYIKQICEFFEVDKDGTKQKEFMKNYDAHFEHSHKIYSHVQGSIEHWSEEGSTSNPIEHFKKNLFDGNLRSDGTKTSGKTVKQNENKTPHAYKVKFYKNFVDLCHGNSWRLCERYLKEYYKT